MNLYKVKETEDYKIQTENSKKYIHPLQLQKKLSKEVLTEIRIIPAKLIDVIQIPMNLITII